MRPRAGQQGRRRLQHRRAVVRRRPRARFAFAQRWATATLTLASAWDDDQGAFNRLAKEGFYPVRRHSADGRVVVGPKGVRIAPLPSDRFCSGHLVWTRGRRRKRARGSRSTPPSPSMATPASAGASSRRGCGRSMRQSTLPRAATDVCAGRSRRPTRSRVRRAPARTCWDVPRRPSVRRRGPAPRPRQEAVWEHHVARRTQTVDAAARELGADGAEVHAFRDARERSRACSSAPDRAALFCSVRPYLDYH